MIVPLRGAVQFQPAALRSRVGLDAVQQEGQALQDVPSNRPDYGELAKLAVQQDCQALQ